MKINPIAFSLVAGLAIGVAISPDSWAADDDENFYKGKQIQLIVSADVGGAYDTYARLISQHMGNHILGNPSFVVQNMVGAGGIRAANYMYNIAPRNGTVIAATHSSIPVAPLTSPKVAEYDANKMNWLGSVSKDPYIAYVWHTAPIQSIEDGKLREITMGGTAVGAAGVDMVIIANELFGFKFKIVSGYKGSAEVKLAMERGEVHGTFANPLGDLKSTKPEWLKEGKVRILSQFGLEKHSELPTVPLFIDQAKTKEDRQLLELLLARQDASKPYLAPPDVPVARVNILRRAFDATMKDPKFVIATEKAQLAVDGPMTGEQLAALTTKLSDTPPSVVKRINDIFAKFRTGGK